MSDLAPILSHGWPGREWTLDGDQEDLANLVWSTSNPEAKPSQVEVDAAEVDYLAQKPQADAERAADARKLDKALVIWLAGKLGITPKVARDEIIAVYKGLP